MIDGKTLGFLLFALALSAAADRYVFKPTDKTIRKGASKFVSKKNLKKWSLSYWLAYHIAIPIRVVKWIATGLIDPRRRKRTAVTVLGAVLALFLIGVIDSIARMPLYDR